MADKSQERGTDDMATEQVCGLMEVNRDLWARLKTDGGNDEDIKSPTTHPYIAVFEICRPIWLYGY